MREREREREREKERMRSSVGWEESSELNELYKNAEKRMTIKNF